MNVGTTEVLLYPRTLIGTREQVNVVSLCVGVTEVPCTVATVSSQADVPNVQDQIESLDLSSLFLGEQGQVRSLLCQYAPIFSVSDSDVDCTDLISHSIPLYRSNTREAMS